MNSGIKWGLVASCVCALLIMTSVQADEKIDFSLEDIKGKQQSLSDYRGKWVLVNYWATWCPPCREELPELESLHVDSKGKIVVLGVNMESISKELLVDFVEEYFLTFPILLAGDNPPEKDLAGPVLGLPTSYLISPEGEIKARQVGPLTADIVRKFITKLEGE